MSDIGSPMHTDLAKLIFVGKIARNYEVLDQTIEMQSLDSTVLDEIKAQCSGLDLVARDSRMRILSVAHSLVRIGAYTFKNFDEKIRFVGVLQDAVLDIFVAHYMSMREEQKKIVQDMVDKIKKSQPTSIPGVSGSSSEPSQEQ